MSSDFWKAFGAGLAPGAALAVSTSTAKTAALSVGERYRVTSDVAVHLRLAPQATAAAVVTDFRLAAGEQIEIEPHGDNDTLAGITAAGSGTVCLAKRLTG